MATDSSELYERPFSHTLSWSVPMVINFHPDDEADMVSNLDQRRVRILRTAAKYRGQIGNLETEIAGLEHTNALFLSIIDQQAAQIKHLEAQLVAAAPFTPALSATDNLG